MLISGIPCLWENLNVGEQGADATTSGSQSSKCPTRIFDLRILLACLACGDPVTPSRYALLAFVCFFLNKNTILVSGWRRISLLRRHKYRDSLSILPLKRLIGF